MSIVLVFCFVVLMIVIRRRKGQSIPLEKDRVKIEWHEVGGETKEPWTEPNMDKAPLIFSPEHLDVTEEQRTGDETV